jgi:small-conductance mechanosensitive channel
MEWFIALEEWFENWLELEQMKLVYFSLFLIAVFVIRFIIIIFCKRFVNKRDADDRGSYPFIKSLINWIAFYTIIIFIIVYFPDQSWLSYEVSIGSHKITLTNVLVAFMIITLGFRISQIFAKVVLQPSFRKYQLDPGVEYMFTRVSHYIIVVLALLIGVMNLGINLSALTVFASVLGVGIGFGLQNITSNFFSGIIILFERPYKIGDTVIVNEILCEVEEIKIRATIVRTFDNERIIIPNSHFIENAITNWSYGDEKMRVVVPIGVAYGTDIELLQKLLMQAAYEQENTMSQPPPRVDFLEYGDSSLNFRIILWVPSPDHRFLTLSSMNFRINELFKEYKIEIPFPQRDLHVRSVDDKVIAQFKSHLKKDEDG